MSKVKAIVKGAYDNDNGIKGRTKTKEHNLYIRDYITNKNHFWIGIKGKSLSGTKLLGQMEVCFSFEEVCDYMIGLKHVLQ